MKHRSATYKTVIARLDRATQYSGGGRVAEHRLKAVKSFTKKYEVDRLVYFEQFDDVENAIRREKRLKKWNRA